MRDLLTAVPLFAGLSSEILARVSELMCVRRLASGQPLFFKGDSSDQLFVIQEGEIKLVLTGGEAQDVVLDVLREGTTLARWRCLTSSPARRTRLPPGRRCCRCCTGMTFKR
jgi:signal-transduction protein with cAMP-binding, CBS, and nucleotidyltransferase domain